MMLATVANNHLMFENLFKIIEFPSLFCYWQNTSFFSNCSALYFICHHILTLIAIDLLAILGKNLNRTLL